MELSLTLALTAFCTSILGSMAGGGGGVLLVSIMSLLLPVGAVVPLHGAVQMVSNSGRLVLLRKTTNWRFVGAAAVGCVAGVLLVGSFALTLPPEATRLILGLGLLYLVWAPKPKRTFDFPFKVPAMAFVVSVIAMLIGPGGILVSTMRRREGLSKEQVMADQSGMMMVMHILKVSSFALFGFNYKAWLPTILPMIAASLCGTLVGVVFLRRLDEKWFGHVFHLVVSLVAGKLLVDAVMAL
jgi:uncharacterized membrane protein YfcA